MKILQLKYYLKKSHCCGINRYALFVTNFEYFNTKKQSKPYIDK